MITTVLLLWTIFGLAFFALLPSPEKYPPAWVTLLVALISGPIFWAITIVALIQTLIEFNRKSS